MQALKQLQIPYSFAKRHGVLIRYEGDQVFIVRRENTPMLAIQEARRFWGILHSINFVRIKNFTNY